MSWLDIAKGIGIILVIVGHCIFPCHELIGIFHMPLFFFLAGITYRQHESSKFILSKINRIGVPYIFWTILSSCLALIPHPYSGDLNGPLWFLQTIFAALVIMYMASTYNKNAVVWTSVICLVFFYIYHRLSWNFLPFHLDRALIAYIYIVTGFLLKKQVKAVTIKSQNGLYAACLTGLFLTLFAYLYLRKGFKGSFVQLTMYDNNFVLVFIASLLGSISVVYISKIISSNRFLEYCGKNSLVIMCVHFPLCQILNVYISELPYFDYLPAKALYALSEWCIVIAFSLACVHLCKRHLPRMSGYVALIK